MPLPFAGPDRLLAHFQRTGDPRALGRLFDRTAPELLRVACWLAGNRADAEDLLQRTFLTVLGARGAYDPTRRALPWLCGILGNHARKLHEQRARPPLVALPAAERDPVAAAANAELAATIARLRDEIGAPYAEVLDLHLAEGLDAKTIAARLGRPAGTVRTQLVRALRRLRQLLPGGFVAGAGALSANAQAAVLASVRATVLRAAGAPATTAVASVLVTLGGVAMAKKAFVLVPLALAATVFGSWVALRGAEPAGTELRAPAAPASGELAAAVAPTVAGSVDATATAVREPVPALAADVDVEPGTATLVVRVAWSDDGGPAADVGIRVLPQPRNAVHERDAITDARGIAVLRGITPGRCGVDTAFTELRWLDLARDAVRELVLSATRDGFVEGTVVDAQQRPVADARLWLSEHGSPFFGHEVGRSDANGRFRLAAKAWQHVGARKAGHAPSRLKLLQKLEPVVLVLPGTGGAVRGRVVGEDGRPIARARVQIGWRGGFVVPGSTRAEHWLMATAPQLTTAADGTFVHEGIEPAGIEVHAWAAGHSVGKAAVLVEPQRTAEVTIVLPRAAVVEGVVVGSDGAPVAGASVAQLGHHADFGRPATTTDGAGRYRLEELPVGRVALVATDRDTKAETTLELVAGTAATWNPALAGLATFRGRLVGPDGAPLPTLQVGVVDRGQPWPSRIAIADDAGEFELQGVEGRTVDLVVLAADQPIAQRAGVARTAERTTIALTEDELPAATVHGRVVDAAGEPIAGATITLMHAAVSIGQGAESGADGTFRRERMRAGRFLASVDAPGYGRRALPPLVLRPRETRDLGDLVLAAAGTVEVTLTGSPQRNAQVKLVLEDGSDAAWFMAEGQVARGELPPGRYVAIAQLGDGSAGSVPVLVRSNELTRATLACAPAAKVTVEWRFAGADPQGILRVLVADSAGEIVDAVSMHLDVAGLRRTTSLQQRLQPGSYRVTLAAEDGRSASAPLHVQDATSTPTVVLELPAR